MNELDGILAGIFQPSYGMQANQPKRNAMNDALNQYAMMQSRQFSQGFDMGTHPSDYAARQASASSYYGQLQALGMANRMIGNCISPEELRERKFKADAEKELCEFLGVESLSDTGQDD